MNCKNCEYGLKQRCGDFEKIICTYEEGECVKITELEKENVELKEKNKALEQYADLADEKVDEVKGQLTKAKEIILKLYNAGRDVLMCREQEEAYTRLDEAINDKSIEQFLEEVGK